LSIGVASEIREVPRGGIIDSRHSSNNNIHSFRMLLCLHAPFLLHTFISLRGAQGIS